MAARLDRQFGPHPDVGAHAQHLGALQQHVQLSGHFQHEKDIEAQAQGLEAQVDEFRVLVTVADDAGLGVAHQGDSGDEFGLGTNFQPVMVVRPKLGDFFHHLLLLVDLDGEHPPVLAGIIQGFDGFAE